MSPYIDQLSKKYKLPKPFPTTVQTPVEIATNRLNYFLYRGKKAATETKRRARFLERAKKKMVTNTSQISTRFKSFFISATPFIGLRTRRKRRGKRVLNKVITLTRKRSQRKAFLGFAATVCISGRATKPFRVRLENALEARHSNKRKRNTPSQPGGTELYDKRALLYTTAYKARG